MRSNRSQAMGTRPILKYRGSYIRWPMPTEQPLRAVAVVAENQSLNFERRRRCASRAIERRSEKDAYGVGPSSHHYSLWTPRTGRLRAVEGRWWTRTLHG